MVFGSLGFLPEDFRFLVDTDSRSRVGLTTSKRTRLAGRSAAKVVEDLATVVVEDLATVVVENLATVVAEAGNSKAGHIGHSWDSAIAGCKYTDWNIAEGKPAETEKVGDPRSRVANRILYSTDLKTGINYSYLCYSLEFDPVDFPERLRKPVPYSSQLYT